jgi:hypothetical protein
MKIFSVLIFFKFLFLTDSFHPIVIPNYFRALSDIEKSWSSCLNLNLNSNSIITIGVPREVCDGENRVSQTPDSVELLINNGYNVVIEKNAGCAAKFDDEKYVKVGAKIINNANDVWKSDIVVLNNLF